MTGPEELYARAAQAAAAARREVLRSLHLRAVVSIGATGYLPDGTPDEAAPAPAACGYCGAELPCRDHGDLPDPYQP